MTVLEYLAEKYGPNLDERNPVQIPNMGRRQLADLFHDLNFKTIVEIGVANGAYSNYICKVNPQAKIYGVDPYEPHEGYIDYKLKSTFKSLKEVAHSRLLKYPNYTFVYKYSADALEDFEDNSIDAVYIDGDHCFESVTFDISSWLKKVRKGGVISGHDYAKHSKKGVKIHVVEAVRGYTDAYHINPWFVIGNHANDEGLIRDRIRSWMWIK